MNPKFHDSISYHDDIFMEFDGNYHKKTSFKERTRIFLDLMDKYVARESRILDLGCGTGRLAFPLAETGRSVMGIDGSEKMIEFCARRAQKNQVKNIRFFRMKFPEEADLEKIGLVDAVICSSVIEYLENPDLVFTLIHQLLSERGMFILSVPNGSSFYRALEKLSYRLIHKPAYLKYVSNYFTASELRSALSQRGFQHKETRMFGTFMFSNALWQKILPETIMNSMIVMVLQK